MLLMLMLAAGLYVMSDPAFAVILASVAPFVPVLTLLWIYQARLRSAGKTLAAFLPNEILRPLLLIALLIGFFVAGSKPSVSTLLWLSLVATSVAVAMMAGYARESGTRVTSQVVDAARQWNRTANHFFLISLCVLGTTTIDILVVGTVLSAEQTGYYAAAQRLASLALLGPDPEARAIAALKQAKHEGIDTMVDATTFDLGRESELLARVSAASGVNLVNVTGWCLDVPRFMCVGGGQTRWRVNSLAMSRKDFAAPMCVQRF